MGKKNKRHENPQESREESRGATGGLRGFFSRLIKKKQKEEKPFSAKSEQGTVLKPFSAKAEQGAIPKPFSAKLEQRTEPGTLPKEDDPKHKPTVPQRSTSRQQRFGGPPPTFLTRLTKPVARRRALSSDNLTLSGVRSDDGDCLSHSAEQLCESQPVQHCTPQSNAGRPVENEDFVRRLKTLSQVGRTRRRSQISSDSALVCIPPDRPIPPSPCHSDIIRTTAGHARSRSEFSRRKVPAYERTSSSSFSTTQAVKSSGEGIFNRHMGNENSLNHSTCNKVRETVPLESPSELKIRNTLKKQEEVAVVTSDKKNTKSPSAFCNMSKPWQIPQQGRATGGDNKVISIEHVDSMSFEGRSPPSTLERRKSQKHKKQTKENKDESADSSTEPVIHYHLTIQNCDGISIFVNNPENSLLSPESVQVGDNEMKRLSWVQTSNNVTLGADPTVTTVLPKSKVKNLPKEGYIPDSHHRCRPLAGRTRSIQGQADATEGGQDAALERRVGTILPSNTKPSMRTQSPLLAGDAATTVSSSFTQTLASGGCNSQQTQTDSSAHRGHSKGIPTASSQTCALLDMPNSPGKPPIRLPSKPDQRIRPVAQVQPQCRASVSQQPSSVDASRSHASPQTSYTNISRTRDSQQAHTSISGLRGSSISHPDNVGLQTRDFGVTNISSAPSISSLNTEGLLEADADYNLSDSELDVTLTSNSSDSSDSSSRSSPQDTSTTSHQHTTGFRSYPQDTSHSSTAQAEPQHHHSRNSEVTESPHSSQTARDDEHNTAVFRRYQSMRERGTIAGRDTTLPRRYTSLRRQLARVPGVLIVSLRQNKLLVYLSRDRPNISGVMQYMTSQGIPQEHYTCQVLPGRFHDNTRSTS